MESIINSTYPEVKIQRCMVHVARNIVQKVRASDRADILIDYKSVIKEQALEQMIIFKKNGEGNTLK